MAEPWRLGEPSWRLPGPETGTPSWRLDLPTGSKAAEDAGVGELRVEEIRDQYGRAWAVMAGTKRLYACGGSGGLQRAKRYAERYAERGAEGVLAWRGTP